MKNFLEDMKREIAGRKAFYISIFFVLCVFFVLPAHGASAAGVLDGIWDGFIASLEKIAYLFLFYILKFALYCVSFLAYFGAWMIDVMLNQELYRSVLVGNDAIDIGWKTVRDFCNMFYVFFLLLIAFATITRSQAYSAKGLLPKLIISMFLINFSSVIAKIVIDLGQVFLFGMAAWLGTFSGSTGGGSGLTSIVDFFQNRINALDSPSFSSLATILFAVIYTFMLGILYMMLAAFLLVRLIMFALLIIVSPFAFFSMVLPSMKKYTTEWWSSLFSNALSGPVFIFFIYISAVMAKELAVNPIDSTTLGDTSNMPFMVPFLNVMIPHLIALGMLWAAIPAAKRIGAVGSSQIVGGRLGMGKALMGGYLGYKLGEKAVKKGASGAAGAVTGAASRADALNLPGGHKVNEKINNTMNSLKSKPIVGEIFIKHASQQANAMSKKVEENQSFMSKLSDKDRKNWVDQSIDPMTKAIRQQAHMNLLAKDSGKDLTDDKLTAMGYDPKKDLPRIYEQSKNFGIDTGDLDKYRLDVIRDPGDREKKIDKIVEDGKEGLIKLDSFKTQRDITYFMDKLEPERRSKFVRGKSVSERTAGVANLVDPGMRTDATTGDLNRGVANFAAELAKGIKKDSTGAPMRFEPIFKNRAGAADRAAFKEFMDGQAHIKDFTKEQVQDSLDHITKGHIVSSKGAAPEVKQVIINHFTAGGAGGFTHADERSKYIDDNKEWNG